MENQEQTETIVEQTETPVETAPVESAQEETIEPSTPEAQPVKIGEVTVTEPITPSHVLASQGIREIILPDGTRQQFNLKDFAARMDELKALQAAAGE